jgi:hypothetical protein
VIVPAFVGRPRVLFSITSAQFDFDRSHLAVTTIAQYVSWLVARSLVSCEIAAKLRALVARIVNMTSAQDSLRQINLGEIAMNPAFSSA